MASSDLSRQCSSDPVRIGVTGHRFLRNTDGLILKIDEGLDLIQSRWPAASLTAISALAEGSDRLIAKRALLRPNSSLVVPLPLPEEEYMEDFQLESSRREFLELLARAKQIMRFPIQADRPAAYTAANQYLLEHCDVLMALWDGGSALGEGGTGTLVAQARRIHLPLYWIWAENCQPGAPGILESEPQGRVHLEGF